ncbi:hypothetical protein, partial [Pseudanabaena sp. 'Roaring Creek']|uniref:hypothetical protein n=1 Tax=Pseudanabaena sp. 'Roaring Creek' TaxID=1681830 RepID=UPI001E3D3C99
TAIKTKPSKGFQSSKWILYFELWYSLASKKLDVAALRAATLILGFVCLFLWWEGSITLSGLLIAKCPK